VAAPSSRRSPGPTDGMQEGWGSSVAASRYFRLPTVGKGNLCALRLGGRQGLHLGSRSVERLLIDYRENVAVGVLEPDPSHVAHDVNVAFARGSRELVVVLKGDALAAKVVHDSVELISY
jgi:hypothetical protein